MFGFGNNREPYGPQDLLCIFGADGTASIASVDEVNDERIYARSSDDGNFSVPLGDVKSYVGPRGRVFLYAAEVEHIADTRRLAALERSIVLQQITHFRPEVGAGEPPKIGKFLLIGGLVVVLIIIMMAVK